MKITVCKGCKGQLNAKDADGIQKCPICFGIKEDSGIPEEVEIADAKCATCGKLWVKDKPYGFPPFYNHATKTYYCGCKGWD